MSITEKLLDTAEYRMRRGGYNAVSFRDLAGDAKIKSSSVHYHFPKKEDLGIAWVEDALPDDLSDDERHTQASTIVAAHQGAMILATSLNDQAIFDRITDHVIGKTFDSA